MIVLHDSIDRPKYRALYRKYKVDTSKFHPRQNLVGKCLLAKWLKIPLFQVINGNLFIHGRFGKPYLRHDSRQFNLTNSHEQVILVADERPVSVDTEKLKPFDYHRIHRAFNPNEIHYLDLLSGDKQSRMTLKLWTVKEGVLKLIGTGLNGGVRTVEPQLPRLKYAWRKGHQYRLIRYNVTPDYVGTIVKEVYSG